MKMIHKKRSQGPREEGSNGDAPREDGLLGGIPKEGISRVPREGGLQKVSLRVANLHPENGHFWRFLAIFEDNFHFKWQKRL